jgi:hypothetical protein
MRFTGLHRKVTTVGIKVYRGIGRSRGDFASDPGDLGRGVYYSTAYARAKCYASAGLETKVITFKNPLILLVEEAYELSDKYGGTCFQGLSVEQKLKNAEAMTLDLLSKGYDGLLSCNERMGEIEVVDFRPFMKVVQE